MAPKLSDGHFLWVVGEREPPGEEEVCFVLDPVMGLLDVDSHRITEGGWKRLSALGADATALLIAPPFTTLTALRGAIATITSKGGFRRVRVSLQAP